MKLDISKAYDRVEWNFLERMMLSKGFAPVWASLIMKCVRSVSYRVRYNSKVTEAFYPQRGLRQGDPLSPYLFIICAEAFSIMLQQAELDHSIEGVQICTGAPRINHLFFADDSLIVMKASAASVSRLQQILALYEDQSGQKINRDKSSAFLSKKTSQQYKHQVLQVLDIPSESQNERYLGLPVHLGAAKSKDFEYIKESIWRKIQGWIERLLSKVGKETLIKAVALAIPTYAIPCFDLTKSLCEEISSMICRYWWSHQGGKHKCHWLGWERLMKAKKDGGLGFRDLHIFNMAMLARQSWRLIQNPEFLCAVVLKAKYHPDCSILEATEQKGMSYTWRSILRGRDLLKEGIVWRIGDGTQVNAWTDPWLPRGSTRRPIAHQGLAIVSKVHELINPVTESWDEELVKELFTHDDARVILAIPLKSDMEDSISWHFDKKGSFSVKSAYRLGVSLREA